MISFWKYRMEKAELLKYPKSNCVRTLIDSQHVKLKETVLSYIFWSLGKKITSKNSFLEVFKLLGLFVNILTPDDKYSLSVKASV